MTDDRDYIDRMIELSEATNGRKPTPEEVGQHFLIHSRQKRGQIYDQIKQSGKNRDFTVRQSAERLAYERAIEEAREIGLKVGK